MLPNFQNYEKKNPQVFMSQQDISLRTKPLKSINSMQINGQKLPCLLSEMLLDQSQPLYVNVKGFWEALRCGRHYSEALG